MDMFQSLVCKRDMLLGMQQHEIRKPDSFPRKIHLIADEFALIEPVVKAFSPESAAMKSLSIKTAVW